MGKRLRGAKLRAQQRAKAAAEELQDQQAEAAARSSVVKASNDELFVLDTTGATVPHHEKPSRPKSKKQKGLSEHDQKLVKQLVQKYSPEELRKMAEAGRVRRKPRAVSDDLDLWKDDEEPSMRRKRNQVKVTVASAGQSYLPDPAAYKIAYQQALEVEKEREKAIKYKSTPIAQGLSKETKALMVGDSDDNEEEDEADHGGPVGAIPKRSNKMTRVQRNAQKRKRAAEWERQQKLKAKKLRVQLSQIGKYRKELVQEEKAQEERQTQKQQPKLAPQPTLQERLRAPTVPLALKDEVASSLRGVRVKGSLVQETVSKWARSKLTTQRPGQRQYHKRKRSVQQKDEAGEDWVVMG